MDKQKKDDYYEIIATSLHQFVSYVKKVIVLTIQGLLKCALAEGDRIVSTILAGSYDQGVYDMGSSYDSLASPLFLQPLKENARLLSDSDNQNNEPSNDDYMNVLIHYNQHIHD